MPRVIHLARCEMPGGVIQTCGYSDFNSVHVRKDFCRFHLREEERVGDSSEAGMGPAQVSTG